MGPAVSAPVNEASIDAVFDEMVDTRRAVHKHPELAFEEHATTALIRDRMAAYGSASSPGSPRPGGSSPSTAGARSVRRPAGRHRRAAHSRGHGQGVPLRRRRHHARLRARRPRRLPSRRGPRAQRAPGRAGRAVHLPVPAGRGGPVRGQDGWSPAAHSTSWPAPAWSGST
jgi:hypothetical protein